MLNLEVEREALYEAIVAMTDQSGYYSQKYVTEKQVQALAILVTHGLQDKKRDNRIAVMKFLIGDAIKDTLGVEFTSFKNMTSPIANFMIDYLKDGHDDSWEISERGRQVISAAEKAVKAETPA